MNEELIEAIFGMTAEAYNARCELQQEMAEENPDGWMDK